MRYIHSEATGLPSYSAHAASCSWSFGGTAKATLMEECLPAGMVLVLVDTRMVANGAVFVDERNEVVL